MSISSCHERDVSYSGWEQMKGLISVHLWSLNFPFAESINGRHHWKRRNVQHPCLKHHKTGWLQPYRAVPHSCRHSTWIWASPGSSQSRTRRNHPARQSERSERRRSHSRLSHAHWWNGGTAQPTHRQISGSSHPDVGRGPVGAQNQAQHLSVQVPACDGGQVTANGEFLAEYLRWSSVTVAWWRARHFGNIWCSIFEDFCPNLSIAAPLWRSEEPVTPAIMGKTRAVVPPFGWKVELQHFQLYLYQKNESFRRFNLTPKQLKMIFLVSRTTVLWISCWSSGAGSTSSTGPSAGGPSSTIGPGTSSLPGEIPRATGARTANRNSPFRCVHIMHLNSNIFFLPKAIFQNNQAHLNKDWTVEIYLQDSEQAMSRSSSWPVYS